MKAPPARCTKAQILRCYLVINTVLLLCNCTDVHAYYISSEERILYGLSAGACAAIQVTDPTHCVSIDSWTGAEPWTISDKCLLCVCACPSDMIVEMRWQYVSIDGSPFYYDPARDGTVDIQDLVSSYTCTPCENGFHLQDPGDSSCSACPVGKFTGASPSSIRASMSLRCLTTYRHNVHNIRHIHQSIMSRPDSTTRIRRTHAPKLLRNVVDPTGLATRR